MMNKESICRNCFHSYVCEQFNENKDDNNTKCHFANDHYIPTADVVPRAMIAEIFEEIEKYLIDSSCLPDCVRLVDLDKIAELKKKYMEENK